jgi:hypothetical protein
MTCEVLILNHRAPFRVHVVAPKAPTDDLACVDVFTTAMAMGYGPVRFIKHRLMQSAIVRHGFEYSGFVLGIVLGAWTEFHRTIAMVVPLHGQTTDAFAVVTALPIVPCDFAKVFVHCDLILLREKQCS